MTDTWIQGNTLRTHLASVLVAGLAVMTSLSFSNGLQAADLNSGKQTYGSCVACHGDAGQGNPALGAPALAGQQAAYLVRQIDHFKSGVRGKADSYAQQMPALVTNLSEQDAADVAAYLETLPAPKTAMAEGDLRKGNNYYHASCGGCHGGKAEGNKALNAPRLAGLDPQYLKRQFKHFQEGKRGTDPSDKYGRQMKMMASVLPDEATVNDVMAYITSLAQ